MRGMLCRLGPRSGVVVVLAVAACQAPAPRGPGELPPDNFDSGPGAGADLGASPKDVASDGPASTDGADAGAAGADASDKGAADLAPDLPPAAPPCTPGESVCDGADLKTCGTDGKPGAVVEACGAAGKACSVGRCTTTACATAEAKQSVVGCLFYGLDTDNSVHDDTQVFGFPIGNPNTAPVSVKVQKKVGGTWTDEVVAAVMPGQVNYLRIATGPAVGKDWHVEGTGIEDKGYRISAESPIVAYQINADDENAASGSSGSTLLIPLHALGKDYYAITPAVRGLTEESFDSGKDFCFVSVVAARDKTKVTVTVAGNTQAGGAVPALKKGDTYEAMLDEGGVLNLECAGIGDDLSGSRVLTDKPTAVYAGVTCGGFDPLRTSSCDHIEEAMYPTSQWGKNFVFLDLRMPAFQPSKSVWARIVAAEDGTELKFDAPTPLSGLPTTPVMLDKGAVYKLELTHTITSTARAHFSIESSKPIAVESFMGQQEGAAIVIPVDQFLDDYLISIHPWFTGHLLITRKIGTPVTLDDMPVAASLFTPAGGGFEASYILMPRCEGDLAKCGHRVKGAQIGVSVTANGGVCNYCYAGGAGARSIGTF